MNNHIKRIPIMEASQIIILPLICTYKRDLQGAFMVFCLKYHKDRGRKMQTEFMQLSVSRANTCCRVTSSYTKVGTEMLPVRTVQAVEFHLEKQLKKANSSGYISLGTFLWCYLLTDEVS